MSKPDKKRRKSNRRESVHSPLSSHKRVGSALVSPASALEKLHLTSWRDDHAPEMLWAFLLASALERADYLQLFRKLVIWCKDNISEALGDTKEAGVWKQPDVIPDHTRLAALSIEELRQFLEPIVHSSKALEALTPLCALQCVPGIDRWRIALGINSTEIEWDRLADAVIPMLDHQSEVSTDVRWLKLVTCIAGGKLRFPESMRTHAEEILFFPDRGDLRSVRPSIRAGEMRMRRESPGEWIKKFWDTCYRGTACLDPTSRDDYPASDVGSLNLEDILNARLALTHVFHEMSTATPNAKLDGIIGMGLYALSLLHEMKWCRSDGLASGRFILRSLCEVLITAKYLGAQNDPQLWLTWRRFGNGQSKLAYLHAERHTDGVPEFIEIDALEAIANDDKWMEFQDIETGHWQKSNLREMAQKSDSKDVYDKYYQWTSTFVHGHWCATRDINFITCRNPLHRLHRIPRLVHRGSASALKDAIELSNLVLKEVEVALTLGENSVPRISMQSE